ncbi:hypothetical protein BDQ17DRAFT_1430658 [Cyathus striatus]|nr:hypothetical protein BDQ17DRAFT_1430658 [Cyathus striatus]
MDVPSHSTVLVVGGGPGGSYAASVLRQEGIDVLLLEADKFPRYHIGESQLASLRHFLRFINLEKAFEEFGFQRKDGAGFKLNKHKREGYTDFVSQDPSNYSWNVIRSQSDWLMLKHAAELGTTVVEETKVTEIEFSTKDSEVPITALWKHKDGRSGKVTFNYLIDASGRAGIMSTKYLRNRKFNQALKNVAIWGYWEGASPYLPGTTRENSPFFEAMQDETGWIWFIPLHDGTTSVGIVMNQERSKAKREEIQNSGKDTSLLAYYNEQLKNAPDIVHLLSNGKLVQKDNVPIISSASDYSYDATSYAGKNYRVIGDAAAFIDPYFSSGVHLAVMGGLAAAASICAVMKNECTSQEASSWHTTTIQASYTRFLLVVLSTYQQIRSQSTPILSGPQEDNFDHAFDFFRPIIQGTIDAGKRVSPEALESTVEFLARHAFEPSQPEERSKAIAEFGDPTEIIPRNVINDNEDVIKSKAILKGIAVRKLMRTEDITTIKNITNDLTMGFKLRLVKGELGLDKVDSK